MEHTGGAAADRIRTAIVIIAIAVLAFALRAIHPPPAGTFASNDALYHVRFAENLATHFPAWPTFDPYLRPDGGRVPVAPLLGLLIAGLSLPAGQLEAIATWLPPILGALAVVPMFFLARRESGWIAALLLAILPGEFLARSRAGNTDHHVLEVLLLLATLCMLRRAIENERRGSAIGAGVFLALYCFAWSSAAMGVTILIAVSFLAPRASKQLAWMFGSASVIVAPLVMLLPRGRLTILLLLLGTAVTSISALRGRRLAVLALLLATGLGIALAPHTTIVFRNYAALLLPDAMSRTVVEGRSLLHADGVTLVWQQFALAGVAALIGLVLLARERRPGDIILFSTSIAFLAAAIAQRRFLYYAAAFVAFLAALALARLAPRQRIASLALIVASIAFAPAWGADPPRDMTPAMREAMTFLRDRTPQPFADPSVYFQRFTTTAPRAAYSVLAWWDHGYAVVRTARRVPAANPTQAGARATAAFLLAQDESAAAPIAERLRARYVVVDSSLMILRPHGSEASIGGTLAQVAVWNGEQPSRYFEQVLYGDRLVWLFYPEYFRSMAARLYLFGGGAARPDFVVVTFREEGDRKRIVALQRFARYRDAMNAVLLDPARHKRLVSIDPRQSCVPVEPLVRYAEVFHNGEVRVFERR